MSAYLLRVCSMRYEVLVTGLGAAPHQQWLGRSKHTSQLYGADKNGLFLEREDAERCAAAFDTPFINEVEVPPDYNGEQDNA